MRNVYEILIRKPEGKRPLGIPRRRCENNNRLVVRRIVCEGVEWSYLVRDRDHWRTLVKTVMSQRRGIS
jgi:hypothetical protein